MIHNTGVSASTGSEPKHSKMRHGYKLWNLPNYHWHMHLELNIHILASIVEISTPRFSFVFHVAMLCIQIYIFTVVDVCSEATLHREKV
jgi:hypothetical protein